MAKKLDKHFKCSKTLKRMNALRPMKDGLFRSFMAAEQHASQVDYVTMTQLVPLPRGMKETVSE